jgi:hypothetical protein
MTSRQQNPVLDACAKLAADGRIIESGFVEFSALAIPADASAVQISAMRDAFMSGAVFMLCNLGPVGEVSLGDLHQQLHRLATIQLEIDRFGDELALRFAEPMGSA